VSVRWAKPIYLRPALLALALSGAAGLGAQESPPGSESVPGGALYQKLCSQCHGEKGDGQGISAPRVLPRPRDFTAGKFKVRTTPNGALPTDADLLAVIKEGMPYTSMPGWSHLSDAELNELVAAVKSFSPAFADPAQKPTPIQIPAAPKPTPESAAKGKEVYVQNGCGACHGELGRGDGSSAPGLKDDWGNSIRPANLTKRWTFRGIFRKRSRKTVWNRSSRFRRTLRFGRTCDTKALSRKCSWRGRVKRAGRLPAEREATWPLISPGPVTLWDRS
jgi:mono/diheme cytochrome c family protein